MSRRRQPSYQARLWLLLSALTALCAACALWLWSKWRIAVSDVMVREGSSDEWPVEIPQAAQGGEPPLQMPAHGAGPLIHRRYRVDIIGAQTSPGVLMQRIKNNVQDFCPATLAQFRKTKGDPTLMRVGDEYDITILGPWNGRVRVVDVQQESFALVTLAGHPEAGEIRFRLLPSPANPGALRFEILSWARSRDAAVDLSYRSIPIGREVQKSAWVEFCRRVQVASGGQRLGKMEVLTEEREFVREVVPRE